ncbi:hypothetical protein [Christensenella tenuis]|uniref:PsbP C-terminal domain-containing protein n=1 Tax=Christensenella tenuis TaxID=2763033 RepID=A0ABR7EIM6_9FIRM|nr:hypothetical protein [Christensenella tenuis]MBC5648864.1 hypothetical protein [Christensenella tenuis]
MKLKICGMACTLVLILMLFGCAGSGVSADVSAPASSTSATPRATASAPLPAQASGKEETLPKESVDPESTTVTGELQMETSSPSGAGMPASEFMYSERYEGDGYSFRYPQGTEILKDEETVKSFLLPGQEYALNVTRLNLSGQDVTLAQALPVYEKALEEQGNDIVETGTLQEFSYDNALIEMKIKEGSSTLDSIQVFFLAGEYNYTFTVSAPGGDMDIMKEIVTQVVESFTASS